MAKNIFTPRYTILTRCLAALALMFVYVVGASAILVGGSTTSAQARGGGFRGGGGGFRGGGFRGGGFRGGGFRGGGFRGRGFGRGYGSYGGGCFWSYRWGRYICPY